MSEDKSSKKEKKQPEEKPEMTLEEARAYRASLYKEEAVKLSEHEKREKFRIYWAENKYQYGKAKDLEDILWIHFQSAKLTDPEDFEKGIAHFGLKKIR